MSDARRLAIEALQEVEIYFDDRADVDDGNAPAGRGSRRPRRPNR